MQIKPGSGVFIIYSFSIGEFTDVWKLLRLFPIFKKKGEPK